MKTVSTQRATLSQFVVAREIWNRSASGSMKIEMHTATKLRDVLEIYFGLPDEPISDADFFEQCAQANGDGMDYIAIAKIQGPDCINLFPEEI